MTQLLGYARVRFAVLLGFLTLIASPAAHADDWTVGALTTYDQADWGDASNAGGKLLAASYDTVYDPAGDILMVGLPKGAGFFMEFDDASFVASYLPASGAAGALNVNLDDPSTSSSGTFGGEVVALALNVDFSQDGLLPGTSGLQFGDLILDGFTGADSALNGMTVAQFLALDNLALGGGATSVSIQDLETISVGLNASFESGEPIEFADDHLTTAASSGVGNGGGGGTTVSEPESIALLSLGLFALASFRFARRRA